MFARIVITAFYRGMGGLLSPPLLDSGRIATPITEDYGHKHTVDDHSGVSKEEEIELMYDPHLNCFYDPITCKYYELLQSD